jgi:hypothetical protein
MGRESSTAKSMCQSSTQFKERVCEIQGSHNSVAKVSGLLGCYTATTGT